jgi:PIN domain nuclease of toxin-antitoxin system
MRALLDTRAFLWFVSGSNKLNATARRCIADSDNDFFLSVASLWEIAIKTSLGRLELLRPFDQLIPEQLEVSLELRSPLHYDSFCPRVK